MGDLRSNQNRKLFLTLKVPSERVGEFTIGRIKVRYLYNGTAFEASLEEDPDLTRQKLVELIQSGRLPISERNIEILRPEEKGDIKFSAVEAGK